MSDGERGSGSVLALAVLGAALSVLLISVALLVANVAHSRAIAVAQVAAIQAADAHRGLVVGVPCELAHRAASVNGAALTLCESTDRGMVVEVRVSYAGVDFRARAHAGSVSQ